MRMNRQQARKEKKGRNEGKEDRREREPPLDTNVNDKEDAAENKKKKKSKEYPRLSNKE